MGDCGITTLLPLAVCVAPDPVADLPGTSLTWYSPSWIGSPGAPSGLPISYKAVTGFGAPQGPLTEAGLLFEFL